MQSWIQTLPKISWWGHSSSRDQMLECDLMKINGDLCAPSFLITPIREEKLRPHDGTHRLSNTGLQV